MTVGRNDPTEERIKANMLQAMVESALQGHDIAAWEAGETPDNYFATCENCGRSIYVSPVTIRSLMAPRCPVRGTVPRIISNLRAAAHLGDRERFERPSTRCWPTFRITPIATSRPARTSWSGKPGKPFPKNSGDA